MEISTARIPMTDLEHDAVEALIAKHGAASLTRRDPGDTGPIVVTTPAGVWHVNDEGKKRKQRG